MCKYGQLYPTFYSRALLMVKIFMHENIVFIYFSALLLLVGTNGNSILFYKTAQFFILSEIKCISRHVSNKLAVLCCFDRLVQGSATFCTQCASLRMISSCRQLRVPNIFMCLVCTLNNVNSKRIKTKFIY